MSISRTEHNKNNPYVMLNKGALEDPNLSWAAKGLWSYLMSKPDHWKVSISHLSKIYEGRGGGEEAIYSLFKELIKFGYCTREQERKEDGTMGRTEYVIHESKEKVPHPGKSDPVQSDPVNPGTSNKGDKVSTQNLESNEAAAAKEAHAAAAGIKYFNGRNEEKYISESDIYKHFLNYSYPTEVVAQAIEKIKQEKGPFGDVLKLLNTICLRLDEKPISRLKSSRTSVNRDAAPPESAIIATGYVRWGDYIQEKVI